MRPAGRPASTAERADSTNWKEGREEKGKEKGGGGREGREWHRGRQAVVQQGWHREKRREEKEGDAHDHEQKGEERRGEGQGLQEQSVCTGTVVVAVGLAALNS